MGYRITACNTKTKEVISTFTIKEDYREFIPQFLSLMGITVTTIRRVYTPIDLRECRKLSVSTIKDTAFRKEIKAFLSECINNSDKTYIDIFFK